MPGGGTGLGTQISLATFSIAGPSGGKTTANGIQQRAGRTNRSPRPSLWQGPALGASPTCGATSRSLGASSQATSGGDTVTVRARESNHGSRRPRIDDALCFWSPG